MLCVILHHIFCINAILFFILFTPYLIISRNINLRDFQRKNVENNLDRVNFKGTMTKWSVQKHFEQHETQ